MRFHLGRSWTPHACSLAQAPSHLYQSKRLAPRHDSLVLTSNKHRVLSFHLFGPASGRDVHLIVFCFGGRSLNEERVSTDCSTIFCTTVALTDALDTPLFPSVECFNVIGAAAAS